MSNIRERIFQDKDLFVPRSLRSGTYTPRLKGCDGRSIYRPLPFPSLPRFPDMKCDDVVMLFRWYDGGPQSLWWDIHVSEWYGVPGVLGGTTVGDHLLRQLRPGHADRLPVHHAGGLDWHALLGESQSQSGVEKEKKKVQKYLTELINIFISLETSGFLGSRSFPT